MPGGDGRAGMIAIIPECRIEDFDLKELGEHFKRALPSYAIPKFLRLNKNLECTATHKIKKVELKKDGYDLARISDSLYVLLPGESEYQVLTDDIYAGIMANRYRF
jgi:citronellyl-CoA synthetase